MNLKKCFGTVLLLAITASPAFAEVNLQEGDWEINAESNLEGLPFPMPPIPMKFSQCITRKDLIPRKQEKNQECTTKSSRIEGNTVNWEIQCKDKSGTITDQKGRATYAGSTFTSDIKSVTTDAKGAKTQMTMKMSGKRIGACK